MPSNDTKKTKLAPKALKKSLLLTAAAIVLVILISALFLLKTQPTKNARINGNQVILEVADSERERVKGLSGRQALEKDKGLLFDFRKNGVWTIWMKDMRFPIDIIWLNDQKKVIYIKENATPESYPESFGPNQPSRYVIELPASSVKSMNIKEGQFISF